MSSVSRKLASAAARRSHHSRFAVAIRPGVTIDASGAHPPSGGTRLMTTSWGGRVVNSAGDVSVSVLSVSIRQN